MALKKLDIINKVRMNEWMMIISFHPTPSWTCIEQKSIFITPDVLFDDMRVSGAHHEKFKMRPRIPFSLSRAILNPMTERTVSATNHERVGTFWKYRFKLNVQRFNAEACMFEKSSKEVLFPCQSCCHCYLFWQTSLLRASVSLQQAASMERKETKWWVSGKFSVKSVVVLVVCARSQSKEKTAFIWCVALKNRLRC